MSSTIPDNILSTIPGQYVSAALRTMPDAASSKDELFETVIEVPGLGKVRFTCRRLSSRKGKTRRWFWTAESAVAK
jgi:hypothetical protein